MWKKIFASVKIKNFSWNYQLKFRNFPWKSNIRWWISLTFQLLLMSQYFWNFPLATKRKCQHFFVFCQQFKHFSMPEVFLMCLYAAFLRLFLASQRQEKNSRLRMPLEKNDRKQQTKISKIENSLFKKKWKISLSNEWKWINVKYFSIILNRIK